MSKLFLLACNARKTVPSRRYNNPTRASPVSLSRRPYRSQRYTKLIILLETKNIEELSGFKKKKIKYKIKFENWDNAISTVTFSSVLEKHVRALTSCIDNILTNVI